MYKRYKNYDILLVGDIMEINLKGPFININKEYFGGSYNILEEENSLCDFSKSESSAFFSITDLLLYEFAKLSGSLGTNNNLDLSIEEYSKYLRNYIDSKPYRFFGFFSLDSIKDYIERLGKKRRINIKTELSRSFVSKSIFEKIIKIALKEDHPLIVQIGVRKSFDFPKYAIITGIDEEYVSLSMRGKIEKIKLTNLFDYSDLDLALLFVEINP